MTSEPSLTRGNTPSGAALRDVSDTALWVALDRARETERRHPLFRDPYARRLADLAGPLFLQWGTWTLGDQLSAAGASFHFAPEEGPDVFRPLGWEPIEVRSAWAEARRLGRESWFLRLLWLLSPPRQRASYQTVSRYVLLARR